ncbi:MAG: hypothetical protein N2578_06550 [Bdellovibrionaceae bacterium]|nr:hypothetical protein [Pseudobdellovibrionaceae bacterium]
MNLIVPNSPKRVKTTKSIRTGLKYAAVAFGLTLLNSCSRVELGLKLFDDWTVMEADRYFALRAEQKRELEIAAKEIAGKNKKRFTPHSCDSDGGIF